MTAVAKLGTLNVSRETFGRLKLFQSNLVRWNKAINLISFESEYEIWHRHIIDCAACFEVCTKGGDRWVDLGSGAGMPGVVLSLLAQDEFPQINITCVESDSRKAEFIRASAQLTNADLTVRKERIEKLAPQGADVVTARALSDLDGLLAYAFRHLSRDGLGVFMKGETWEEEVERAESNWQFELTVHPSWTNKKAAILEVRNIIRA